VPTIARSFVSALRDLGHQVTIAFPAYRSIWPHLSVRAWQLPIKKPRTAEVDYLGGAATAVGAYLPELEATRYLLHDEWRKLIAAHDAHVAVLGSVLPAYIYAAAGIPALCWAATSYIGDRKDRMRNFSTSRAVGDYLVELPVCTWIERYVLRHVDILSLSSNTLADLRTAEPQARLLDILSPPVDTSFFRPGPRNTNPAFRIGFVGRIDDPRKNVELLVRTTALLRSRGVPVETHTLGGEPTRALLKLIAGSGLNEWFICRPFAAQADLLQFYQSLDAFVIPSHQEGLALVGLEAMACGIPVVTTRCGGPSDYVHDGENGFQVGFDVAELADRIQQLLEDAALRRKLGDAARNHVTVANSAKLFREKIAANLRRTFPHVA
jgi:glycosyltransferase involved in cell wall biosynthesis